MRPKISRGGAKSGLEAVVYILSHREIWLNGVDKTGDPVVIRDDAQGGLLAERRVETELPIYSSVAAVHASQTQVSKGLCDVQLRGIRDVAYGAAQ